MGADGERITGRSAVGLGGLVLATFTAITTEIIPIGLLPLIVREYRVSTSVAGLLVTVFAVLVAALAVPLTSVTARLPRKPVLLATVLLYAVANTVIALAPTFAVVCAGRALGGVAHALFFSVSTAYAAALVPPRAQGRAIAIGLSGATAGYVLGVPVVTAIGAGLGERASFGLLAAGGVLVAVVVAVALPAIPNADPPPADRRRPARVLVGVALANLVAFLAHYTLYTYVSALLTDAGMPEGALPGALLLLGAAGIVGLVVAGIVVDRRPRAGLVVALAVATACLAALLLVRGSAGATLAVAAAWSVAFSAMPTFFATGSIRAAVLPPDLSGAVNNAVSNIGIGGGAALGGGLVALGGTSAATAVALGLFAVALVVVPFARTGFPSRPST